MNRLTRAFAWGLYAPWGCRSSPLRPNSANASYRLLWFR